jgi:hypothetical protein
MIVQQESAKCMDAKQQIYMSQEDGSRKTIFKNYFLCF